ncbi:hybrid sensor histidine kinase/response regulator [Paenibacillus cymbidii]|uniref:hybrid sensor histidine kinase/response regulator n=1 Tax=Paenibacillus cymbidii TaxID=1639034 RepID=UPI001F2F0647|nr:ATP-binding protein [Paenibacillus cymbidii]
MNVEFSGMRPSTKTTLGYIAAMLLFLGVLFAMRMAWTAIFPVSAHPKPVQGILDLRGIDLEKLTAIPLDGEWQLYPGELVSRLQSQPPQDGWRTVRIPGNWKTAQAEASAASPYGYGTYRLLILVEPLKHPVSLWVQNIQAASEIEINGQASGGSGTVAALAEDYRPENISYAVSYSGEGVQELELLIRVANFDEPLAGGMVRSIQFGSQAAVDHIRWYSIGFQLLIFVILLLHGLYIWIIYLFNPINRKERSLYTTGLLMLAVGFAVLIGHDNLLLIWLPFNYTWTIKLRLIFLLWQNLFLLRIYRHFASAPPDNVWLRLYTALLAAITVALMATPVSWVNVLSGSGAFLAVYGVSFGWFLYTIGTMIARKRDDPDLIYLLLTAAGIVSNLSWSIAESNADVTIVYYPIDLMIALVGFSTYWFKKYIRHSNANVRLNAQLLEADKRKDQFLTNTSHELRTPLHGIINIAQSVAAKEKDRLDAGSLKDIELLVTVGRHMSHMVNDLLDAARLREQRIVLQRESARLQAIVPGVIGMLRFIKEGKPIQLRADIPASLPPVFADEKRLVQVLYNLLHNALKYTEEGSVTVHAETQGGRAFIRVADTGVGMDEETRARVFLPYEQGNHGINDGRGIGLGLSICKQLVELHGGELSVASEPGKGSVFRFDLPLADAPSLAQAAGPRELAPSGGEANELPLEWTEPVAANGEAAAAAQLATTPPLLQDRTVHILAVDDNPVNLSVLTRILAAESYAVTTAGSGREALELLAARQWDLLIVDVMMPHMSGYELTQRVRETYAVSELPVLLLTARSQPADIYAGFLSGASDYVAKPVDALELRYRIRALTALKMSVDQRLRMEAAYLQAQIHPHFLFNTLNSIMALSEIDTEQMRRLGNAFASYLRIGFDFLNTGELVDLSRELELAEMYLYIEKARFGERLAIVWEIDPVASLRLPPLTIQPLVENAVKHGLMSLRQGGTLTIRVRRQERGIGIEVCDNGKGMEQEQADRLLSHPVSGGGGIGLANTNRRLTQHYGRGLSIRSAPHEGTVVSFFIPDRPQEQ